MMNFFKSGKPKKKNNNYILILYSDLNETITRPIFDYSHTSLDIALRGIYDVYLDVNFTTEGVIHWVLRASALSHEFNLEYNVLMMLMHDTHYDYSILANENIVSRYIFIYIIY